MVKFFTANGAFLTSHLSEKDRTTPKEDKKIDAFAGNRTRGPSKVHMATTDFTLELLDMIFSN